MLPYQHVLTGPLAAASLTPALEVVSGVDLLPLFQLTPDEGPAVHVQDLRPGADLTGGEGGDGDAALHPGVVGVAGVVDQGQGRVYRHTCLDNLVATPRVFAGPELCDLVRVVKHNSHEMMNKPRNEHFIRRKFSGLYGR